LASCSCRPIPPGRRPSACAIKWSPFAAKGVEARVYQPGAVYFFPAFLKDWHVFDTKLQNVEMTRDPRSGDKRVHDELLFKTLDGNDISLDVIFSYRIDPEKAPYTCNSSRATARS